MSAIDELISSRRKGRQESDRRQFSVDRDLAIQKMREFSLEDPSYYLLELVQSAVANGASQINLRLYGMHGKHGDMRMRWDGEGFSDLELQRLYDFLFMSEREPGCADTILLARAINAMQQFDPQLLIITCGDGTMAGTRRYIIREGEEKPVEWIVREPLDGVSIQADRLRDSLLEPGPGQQAGDREVDLLREKCILPDLAVVFNNQLVSRWQDSYPGQVWDGSQHIEIAEDDLFGRLWTSQTEGKGGFDLMTYGVKIERIEVSDGPLAGLSGAINFDRLNKTADHAKIVRDEVLAELWARLRPYARVLSEEHGEIEHNISSLGGQPFKPGELLELIHRVDRVVVIEPKDAAHDERRADAKAIGESLGASVLVAPEDEVPTLRGLAGGDCEVVVPRLRQRRDVSVFGAAPHGTPPRPWLAEPVSGGPFDLRELLEFMVNEAGLDQPVAQRLFEAAGSAGEVHARVYSPNYETQQDQEERDQMHLLVCGRQVWSGQIESDYAGHEVFIEFPPVSPSELDRTTQMPGQDRKAPLAAVIARQVCRRIEPQLEAARRHALRSLTRAGTTPGSSGSRMALDVLSREALLRVRSSRQGRPEIIVSVRSEEAMPLLDVPLFETLEGEAVSGRDLQRLLAETYGLIYAVRDGIEADLEGLDESRVLTIDAAQEAWLVEMFGGDALVRVDRRDVLAEYAGLVVRDIALGLRPYPDPDFELLVEDASVADLSPERRCEAVEELVRQLVAVVASDADTWKAQEARRHARRHLLYFLAHRKLDRISSPMGEGVAAIPLVDTAEQGLCSFEHLVESAEDDPVVMLDGRAVDVVAPTSARAWAGGGDGCELRMNPFLFYLLEDHLALQGAFDYDLSHAEAAQGDAAQGRAFLADQSIELDEVRGLIGLPAEPVDKPSIAVIGRESNRVSRLRGLARELGLVGRVVVDEDLVGSRYALEGLLLDQGEELLERLLAMAPRVDEEDRRRVEIALLNYAGSQLELRGTQGEGLSWQTRSPLARQILELPLFAAGEGPQLAAMRLVRHFCARRTFDDARWVEAMPEYMGHWKQRYLVDAPVYWRAPDSPEPPRVDPEQPAGERLLATVEHWLDRLRPEADCPDTPERYRLRWLEGSYGWSVGLTDPFCHYVAPTVMLNKGHPIVAAPLREGPWRAEELAWLLLAVYAHLNYRLGPVSNEHEMQFQRRVADALRAGAFDEAI